MSGLEAALFAILGTIGFIGLAIIYGYVSRRIWMKKEGIDPKDPEGGDKWLEEQRWKRQEEEDKRILANNPTLKRQMENAFVTLQAEHSILQSEHFKKDKFHAELCVNSLTPELFIEKYDVFKTKDRRKIKNAIYQERPYFTHDVLIDFVLYIFENDFEIDMLNYIAKSRKIQNCPSEVRERAKEILKREAINQ